MSAASATRKAIIVAAGRGSRLGDKTEEIPKCMVKVAGRSILHHQLSALSAAGVDDVVVVRGYRGELIDGAGQPLRFVENPDWPSNNILASLLYASQEMNDGFFFSYSDIVYAPAVASRLAETARQTIEAAAPVAAALVVDRHWDEAYVGRTQHPISEAELTKVDSDAQGLRISEVGKLVVPPEQAIGEFIGLAWFSPEGARELQSVWQQALASDGLEAPFGRARTLRNAYLSDGFNALARNGHRLLPVFIDGQWREIDTGQDLAAAESVVPRWA